MNKFLLALVAILLSLLHAYCTHDRESFLHEIEQVLIEKYCPFYDFQGKASCPSTRITRRADTKTRKYTSDSKTSKQDARPNRVNAQILGGLGYNSVHRRLSFPILQTQSVVNTSITTAYKHYQFNTVQDFIASVDLSSGISGSDGGDNNSNNIVNGNDNINNNTSIEGGLFAESNAWLLTNMVSLFGDVSANIQIAQKEYCTHRVTASTFTPEFVQFLDVLPTTFDPSNSTHTHIFQLFFDLFGTGAAQDMTYGGLIYLQTSIKQCYGGSVTPDLIRELEANITREPSGPLAYLRYRKLGLLQVTGGNPELDVPKRTETFADAPAVLRLEYKNMVSLVPEPLKQVISKALNWYTSNSTFWKQEWQHHVQESQKREYMQSKQVRIFRTTSTKHFNGPTLMLDAPCGYCVADSVIFYPQCVIEDGNTRLSPGQEVHLSKRDFKASPAYEYGKVFRRADTGMYQFYHYRLGMLESFKNDSHAYHYSEGRADSWGTPITEDYFVVVDCEPVIVRWNSGTCGLNYHRVECRCAGY
jgi:hypothetical protein